MPSVGMSSGTLKVSPAAAIPTPRHESHVIMQEGGMLETAGPGLQLSGCEAQHPALEKHHVHRA